MTAFVLGLPEHKVRVIAPDVGGGFGSKIFLYAEDVALTWAAKQLNRSIKWTADRCESFLSRRAWPRPREPRRDGDGQGRESSWRCACTPTPTSALTCRPSPPRCPPSFTRRCWPASTRRRRSTWKSMPGSPTPRRSMPTAAPAGPRPPTCWSGWSSRCAWEMGLGAGRNPQAQLHHQLPVPDAGGAAVRHGGLPRLHGQGARRWPRWTASPRARRPARPRASCAASATPATSRPAASRRPTSPGRSVRAPGLFECGEIRVHPTGSVTVFTGSHSHGQGHETTFAQVVAARLGIPVENVDVVHGDTGRVPFGMGTYGSRSISRRRRGHHEGAGQDRDQGQEDRGAPDGSERCRRRVRQRRVHRQGHRQEDHLRPGGADGLRAAQLPAGQAGAGPERNRVLRPDQLHLPGRHLHLRGGSRQGRPARSGSTASPRWTTSAPSSIR